MSTKSEWFYCKLLAHGHKNLLPNNSPDSSFLNRLLTRVKLQIFNFTLVNLTLSMKHAMTRLEMVLCPV